jgi:LacI family transcriptional regulator
VLQAANQLGYVMPSQSLANGPALSEIGFLFSPVNARTVANANPFWSHILAGVDAEARKSRIKLTYRAISEFHQGPQALFEEVRGMRLDGLLVVGPAEPAVIRTLQTLQLPLVLVESYTPGQEVDAVISDGFEGARQATAYLIGEGHREIAFINGPLDGAPRPRCRMYAVEMRARGYRAALVEAGLPVPFDLMEAGDLTPQGGYEACRRLLGRRLPFSALFCANDSMAIGAMKALHEAGLAVPGAVSIIGYGDDADIIEHLTPALTTVRIDKETVGATAVKRLLARAADPSAAHVLTVLEAALITRESVCARG